MTRLRRILRRIKDALWRTVEAVPAKHTLQMAAALSYYFVISLFPAFLLVGYAFAWFAHFIVEKNRPATFKYPLYSFVSDWVMYGKILSGSMRAEVERALAK